MKSKKKFKILFFSLVLAAGLALGSAAVCSFADEYTDAQGVKYNYTPGETTASVASNNNTSLSGNITIPSIITVGGTNYTVTTIGDVAFRRCSALTSVDIPSSVTTIGNGAFSETGLTSVTIPSSVTTIGNGAFSATRLTSVTIPLSVTTIGEGAFSGCGMLTSVSIPQSVTTIGEGAFSETGLTSVTIPSSVTTIGNGAFNRCSALTSVDIPSSVTTIGNYAFYACSALTSVTIPSSVTTIGNGAFAECTNLTSVTFEENSQLRSIGDQAFHRLRNLTSVIIPQGVTSIGKYAFYMCDGLTTIVIPPNVTTIGKEAFIISTTSGTVEGANLFVKSGLNISTDVFNTIGGVLWRYEVLTDQTGAPNGKTKVKITEKNGQKSRTSVACNAMGDEYVIDSVEVSEVNLTHNLTAHPAVAATMTSVGNSAYWSCSDCGKYFSDAQGTTEIPIYSWIIPLTGHNWADPTYTWSQDNNTCTAARVCIDDNSLNETETVNTVSEQITTATCEGQGVTNYTATFTNNNFLPQTKTVPTAATGHTWGQATYTWSNDKSQCIAERTCSVCNKKESETVDTRVTQTTAATCTTTGTKTYTATFANTAFSTQTTTEEIPAHHTVAYDARVEATCTEAGHIEGYTCSKCQKHFSDEDGEHEITADSWVIDIDEDAHNYGVPEYEWADDNSTCTATRVCANDQSHVKTENGTITSAVKVPAACIVEGTRVYIANFANGAFLTQTKDETIQATGHTWSTEWSARDGEHWHECTVCGEKNDEATHTLVKEERIEANKEDTGHIEGYTCSVCGKHFRDEQGLDEISEANWTIPYSIYDLNKDGLVNVKDTQLHFNVVAAAAA